MRMARARVEYWEKWGGKEREAMQAVVQAFNRSQDEHEVIMRDAGDWSSSPDLPTFLAAQADGTPPDVIGLEDHQIVDLSVSGAIKPLALLLDLTAFRPEFSSLGVCNGALHAVPVSVDVVTLYLNLSAVRGTVFDGGRLPPTIEEFDGALAAYEQGGRTAFVPTYPGWWPQAWAGFFGGCWADEDGSFTPGRPGNVRALEWVRSLRDRLALRCSGPETGWICKLLGSTVNPIGKIAPDPFLAGDVAMVFEGDWLVRRLAATLGLDWLPAAFPCADGVPSALVVADLLAIPAGARNSDGAAEFIRFATSPGQVERLALAQGKVSPLRDWSAEFLAGHSNPRIRDFQAILKSARLLHDPRVPGWLGYLDRIKAAFAAVWLGEKSPDQVLRAFT